MALHSSQNSQSTTKSTRSLEVVIFLLFAFGPIVGNVVLVLLAPLSLEFAVDPTAVLIAIPAFMFPFAVVQLFSGAISDVKGRFPVILAGLAIFTISSVVAVAATSLFMYALANVLGGIGFGFINPVLIALITDVTPKHEIAKKMGFLGAVASLGVGLGPLIAGQMVRYGWRSVYILFVVVTIAGIIAFAVMRRHHRSEGVGGGLQELLNNLSLEMRRPVVILLVITAFFVPLTYLAILIWTARALTGIINEATIGIILSMVGFSGAAAGISMGYIMKRFGVLVAIATGLVTLLIGVLILIGFSDFTAIGVLIYIAVALLLIGFAGGMLFPAVIFYSQVISPERSGTLAGAVTAFQFTGVALVPFIYAPFFVQSIQAVYLAILVASIMLILIITALYFVARRMLH